MTHACVARWLTAGLVLSLAGCATGLRVMDSELDRASVAIELADTPFYAQVTDQCGPSALATILNVSGIDVTADALKSQVYIPEREGSLQIELLAATRGFRRIPYQIEPDIMALLDELYSERPVLVLQNLGGKIRPVWHYAVVVGYLPEDKQFVLRSGDQQRYVLSAKRFLRTWQRADFWGIVSLRPGELPASLNAARYIRAVAALENLGDADSAGTSYLAATERWPEDSLAWLGLGNSYYTHGKLDLAENAYRRLLALEPDHPAGLNNLSQVLADQGCYGEAAEMLDAALTAADSNEGMFEIIQKSRAELTERGSSAGCH